MQRHRTLIAWVCAAGLLSSCGDDEEESSGNAGKGGSGDADAAAGSGGDVIDIGGLVGDRDRDSGMDEMDASSPAQDGGMPDATSKLGNGEACEMDEDCESGDCSQSVSGALFCYGTVAIGGLCSITQDCAQGLCLAMACTDPSELLPNGSACSESVQCASLNCGQSVGGDHFCYGDAPNGDSCEITQDCAVGVCREGTCADPARCTTHAECAVNAICNDSQVCEIVCGTNAAVVDNTCRCLPGFDWASDDPRDTSCVRPDVLAGCHLLAQDADQTYLGELGDCFAANSACNERGSYGSELSATSIFNRYGTFGSEFSSYSAFNPNTQTPPAIVCDGTVTACVTVNELACPDGERRAPTALCDCD